MIKRSQSRAHNIAHAGGLYQTEDKVIPMRDFEAFKLAKDAAGNTLLLGCLYKNRHPLETHSKS
ncbi:hypothetical protein AB7W88_08975 [Providencia vermicola]|uniref:hypothetical protein n=1 Tax=Providencia vermicola TaxID=333965 RepID=UPI0034E556EC